LPEGARERSIRLFADDPAEWVRKPATLTLDQVRKGVIQPGIDCTTVAEGNRSATEAVL